MQSTSFDHFSLQKEIERFLKNEKKKERKKGIEISSPSHDYEHKTNTHKTSANGIYITH